MTKTNIPECTPDKCCCCIDLNVGCNVIAGINLSAGFCIGLMVGLGFGDVWEMKACFLIIAIISVAAGCSLLHGSVKQNKVTTAAYLVLSVINAVICLIIAINSFSGYPELDNFFSSINSSHIWIVYGLIWTLTGFVYIYFGIIVFSYLMEIVAEESVDPMEPSDVTEEEEEESIDDTKKEAPAEEESGEVSDSRRSSMWTIKLND